MQKHECQSLTDPWVTLCNIHFIYQSKDVYGYSGSNGIHNVYRRAWNIGGIQKTFILFPAEKNHDPGREQDTGHRTDWHPSPSTMSPSLTQVSFLPNLSFFISPSLCLPLTLKSFFCVYSPRFSPHLLLSSFPSNSISKLAALFKTEHEARPRIIFGTIHSSALFLLYTQCSPTWVPFPHNKGFSSL